MPADEYGRSLRGLSINLLVRDIPRALAFAREVLGVEPVYSDPDFAVLRHGPSEWMLHADHTYRDHPLHGSLAADDPRGIGAEIRLHDTDPDAAEAAARERAKTRSSPGRWTSRTASAKSSFSTRTAISGRSTARLPPTPPDGPSAAAPLARPGPRPALATRLASMVHYAAGGR